jgi:predicted nucleic acid-binding protein
MLCDAGPIVALLDEDDRGHAACVAALPSLSLPLVTTWPCFTEAFYLLGRHGGWPAQARLWQFIERGTLRIHVNAESDLPRMRQLMERYRDTPMDVADASLVAAAEALGESRIFTLDHHFRIYRIGATGTFEVVP